MGDWDGLAIDSKGSLWHAGKWTAGLITFDPSPLNWFRRNGAAFEEAFGDPYSGPGTGGFANEPVFKVAMEGHPVHLSAVTVCPDGKVWFGSHGPSDGVAETVASFDGLGFTTFLSSEVGLAETAVRDVVCLPDGRLVFAGGSTGLSLFDPVTGNAVRLTAGTGHLPSDRVLQLDLDRMADPPSLHVATSGGAAVLRVFP
jgi:streptogramin lyase